MKTKFLYIIGSESGVGKTTICEGLLAQLLIQGYQPQQLAYIKPMTQCIDKQAVTRFCEREHIAHRSLGGLVFKKGFTQDFIKGLTKNSTLLLEDILADITQISEGKNIVIVDGVGGPSTGSVIGVSNIDIAVALAAPVLFVGKAGIGSAIDDTVFAVNFMQQRGIKNIALVYNKIELSTLANIKHCLNIRLAELFPHFPVLDFIVKNSQIDSEFKRDSAVKIYQWFNALALS